MKEKLGLYGGISLSVFLFILFFQPFPNEFHDVNNMLIFTAGFGAIVFLLLYMAHLVFSRTLEHDENEALSYFHGIALMITCSVAFAFYLRYVGNVTITFPIILKVVIICFAPPISLRIYDVRNEYRWNCARLIQENGILQQKIDFLEAQDKHKTIELFSNNLAENMKLSPTDIVLMRSADNYVEICYLDGLNLKKKLLRNTLNSIEQQVRPYALFLRCHRTYIVNIDHIELIRRKFNSHWLIIRNFNEQIPVSRQYLLRVKEALAMKQG